MNLPKMNLLNAFLLVAFCLTGSQAIDTLAVAKCRELHHVEPNAASTLYSNNNCLLSCVINGVANVHNMNEGFTCPLAEQGKCHNGRCVLPTDVPTTAQPTLPTTHKPTPAPTTKAPVTKAPTTKTPTTIKPTTKAPIVSLGTIDIEILSSSFAKPDEVHTPYVSVCVHNSSVPLTLPLTDKHTCVLCNANLYTPKPTWNSVCTGLFVNQAAVYFEVKDTGVMHTGNSKSEYLGGAALTIPQLLSHGDNHKDLNLAFTGSSANSGYLNVRITWTPKTH